MGKLPRPEPGETLLKAGVIPMAPAVFLAENVLPQLGINTNEAAAAMGLSASRFAALLAQQEPVTRDIATRLAVLTGMSEQFWLNMQAAADRKATV